MQLSFKDRLAALCGYGAQSDFAEAAGIHVTNLSRQIAKGEVDRMIIGHLEWLEAVPVKLWPLRWAKLAARVKAKTKKEAKAA